MKKTLKLMLTLVIAFTSINGFTVGAQEETIKIGVLQYVEHAALDASREGFVDRLTESEYGDRIEFDIQNASGNQSTLQSISEMIARENDILYAIATPPAVSLANLEQEKPIFIAAVADPVAAGVAESLEEPGRNVTGTTNAQPLADQVDLLARNFPDAETVGILYNSSEVNAQSQVKTVVPLLEEKGLEVVESTVVTTNDVSQALNSIIGDIDVLFMVTDNTIDSAISLVGDIAKENNVPTVGTSDVVVLENGLMTISNSYYDYGVQTADMVIRMLDEGLDPAEMPIELGQDFQLVVNEEFANAIGIDPESLK
ncbi:ABC transporter substrate-binding protein [Aerococcaceae bacterium DSM 111022]|nr:ABC transporter substrate-binding protein [Aerococcaceae bacterium DSM 111022]